VLLVIAVVNDIDPSPYRDFGAAARGTATSPVQVDSSDLRASGSTALTTAIDEPYSLNVVERLYEKSSSAGEPPRHEADHGSVHERFTART
jgi:hypothetical protein